MLAQFLTEIALPMLFAAIDALMCLLDYFKPSAWNDQLECIHTFKHAHAHTRTHMLAYCFHKNPMLFKLAMRSGKPL